MGKGDRQKLTVADWVKIRCLAVIRDLLSALIANHNWVEIGISYYNGRGWFLPETIWGY
jgi:hypothetical protein